MQNVSTNYITESNVFNLLNCCNIKGLNIEFVVPGIPYITDCVMAEIEKLGMKYRVALRYKIKFIFFCFFIIVVSYPKLFFFCFYRIAKDPRFERLPCTHKGTYADDCLVQRVTQVICDTFV